MYPHLSSSRPCAQDWNTGCIAHNIRKIRKIFSIAFQKSIFAIVLQETSCQMHETWQPWIGVFPGHYCWTACIMHQSVWIPSSTLHEQPWGFGKFSDTPPGGLWPWYSDPWAVLTCNIKRKGGNFDRICHTSLGLPMGDTRDWHWLMHIITCKVAVLIYLQG